MALLRSRPVARGGGTPNSRPRLWTALFTGLCFATFLAFSNQALLVPTIPLYVQALGGSEATVGFVLAAFSVASFTVRPWIGYWADNWSVLGVLAVGTLLLTAAGLLFLVPLLWLVALGSAIRGVGWAANNTGSSTFLAKVAPTSRRGEASGYYTLFQNSASAVLPALALWLVSLPAGGYGAVFLLASTFAAAATLITAWLWHKSERHEPRRRSAGGPSLATLIDRDVLLPTVLLIGIMLTQPAALGFVPLYAERQGIQGVGWYYFAGGVVSIAIRGVVGRLSDTMGRGVSVAIGLGFAMAGLGLLIAASTLGLLVAAGALYAVGQAFVTTSLVALAIDRANPERRGAAMATFTAAYQVGAGIGAPIWGLTIEAFGYQVMYALAAGVAGVALLVAALNWPALERKHVGPAP